MNGDLDALVDEVMHLIRSQFIAIVGNVLGVIPAMLLVCWIYQWVQQAPLLTPEKALHTLHDYSVLGPTPLYAYFTGVLLWLSSVFSGWVENWFVFHKMTAALASHRGLRAVLGVGRSVRLARFLRRHVLGLSANISLGMLLGFLPSVLQYFWDFQIEVRHVTLSSGSLAAAVFSLPGTIFQTWDFWLAVLGILSMALLNVTVSFGLALLVAVKARQVQAPKRQEIYQAVYSRIKRKPTSLFWPGEKQNIS
jgi:site-specific recombinase